jgi:class III poly(R)-hydroxyalkanoic acid synthase PhaE subunit
MSDPFAPESWTRAWQDLQQQFSRTWQDASQQAGAAKMPLQEGFEQWLKQAGGNAAGNDVIERMIGGARQFVALMQSTFDQAGGQMKAPGTDWAAAIGNAFNGVDLQHNPVADALRRATGDGARSFEQLFAQFSAAAKPLTEGYNAALHLPNFGYSRESQERQQKLVLAFGEQATQLERYNRLMIEASRRALEKLEGKLAEHSEPGRQLKSFREVYDTWIDAAEEGYAEVAMSAEFRHAYGALVNSQMRVRQMVQQAIERSTGSVGMPTRSELDAVHQKLAQMKRRIAELEHSLALAEIVPLAEPAATTAPRAKARRARARKASARATPAALATPEPVAKRPRLRIVAGTDVRAARGAPKVLAAEPLIVDTQKRQAASRKSAVVARPAPLQRVAVEVTSAAETRDAGKAARKAKKDRRKKKAAKAAKDAKPPKAVRAEKAEKAAKAEKAERVAKAEKAAKAAKADKSRSKRQKDKVDEAKRAVRAVKSRPRRSAPIEATSKLPASVGSFAERLAALRNAARKRPAGGR